MKTRIFALAVLVLVFAAIAVAADDPFTGTWKLNVAKSAQTNTQFENAMLKYEIQGENVKASGEDTSAGAHYEIDAKFDGKFHPVTGNGPSMHATALLVRVGANMILYSFKSSDGKDAGLQFDFLSNDLKTIYRHFRATNSQGKEINNGILVFDKQ